MGVTGQMLREEADFLYHVLDLGDSVRLVLVEVEVVQAFGDDVVDRRALVKGSGGVLEDHLYVSYDLPVQ